MTDSNPTDLAAFDEARKERAMLESQKEADDIKWVMSNKRGRRFMYRQLERAGVWRISFNTNALAMAFNEGGRNEGLRLIALLTTHCMDRYTEMLGEKNDN